MRKTMKKTAALTLAFAMVFSITGCNSSSNSQPTETKGTTSGEQVQTEEGTEPVTIKITWWGGQARHDYTQKLLDLYTELNPHVTFEASPSGWDGYFDKLATNAASGTMPDIVQMDYLYISTYARNNSLTDLQPFIDDGTIDLTNVSPVLYNSGKIDDKMAGMVLSSTQLAVAYNEDVMAEAGIEAPKADWTWDDFKNICLKIKEKTGKMGTSYPLADDTNNFNYYVRQHGYQLFSEDNLSLGYDDDQIYIDFVNMISELIKAGAMPNPDEYAAITAKGDEASPLVTGDAGISTAWANYAVRVQDYTNKLRLVTPPYGDNGVKGLWQKPGMFFSIAETSKVKEEAAKFIDWFINSEEANDIILAERGTPVSSEIRAYLSDSGKLSDIQVEMFGYTDVAIEHCSDAPAPDPAGIAEINAEFNSTVYGVLYGQSTPEEAAAAFRQNANEILERNNK
ncbi:carbohydrate ABC transporter substrate-binding protein (CUT1 family) [Hungatella effluvii]|uniref:Carbohydrate ABC transporter substrate-binding protein (CUT1 family) n=1 Tax=Hungatella effluvii TaxID=1096246 RepID=A0A2V3Y4X0_9FIRM|nr:sugar ABC transporter substrate-binding protein [Hungatella effluvii]PXX52016.1 carbohydrate ABC transporter substrate-binding protein (CUT1 family) [Hungatella effluvii]